MPILRQVNSPHASRSYNILRDLADQIQNPTLSRISHDVICCGSFQTAFGSGSAEKHHGYEGGLIVHTAEVTSYAAQMSKMFQGVDYDVLITAAIFHDFKKILEYQLEQTQIVKTQYRKLVRHVAGSHAEFMVALNCEEETVPPEKVLGVEHAILAHHGRFEWGSPVEPQTLEALILHQADVFSSLYGPERIQPYDAPVKPILTHH